MRVMNYTIGLVCLPPHLAKSGISLNHKAHCLNDL